MNGKNMFHFFVKKLPLPQGNQKVFTSIFRLLHQVNNIPILILIYLLFNPWWDLIKELKDLLNIN